MGSVMEVRLWVVIVAALGIGGWCSDVGKDQSQNYKDALSKSILFFEGQRSGKLPSSQRLTWRKNSALHDGQTAGVDLVGGYYDAGDNVKFGFPMAFTTTVLAWSIVEFDDGMGSDRDHAVDALRWATDYLLKATSENNKVYAQAGNPNTDHRCWERPEDMDTSRDVYFVDAQRPGSEVAAETAAALAASSIVFKTSDPSYAQRLLSTSMRVFNFADKYRGSYNNSIGDYVCPFYCDYNGYQDELIWGAAWIYKASNIAHYWNYVTSNIGTLSWYGLIGEFGWDSKYAGLAVLLYREFFKANNNFSNRVAQFACTILPESPTRTVKYTPGGLLYKTGVGNMQNVASLSFLLIVLSKYLNEVQQTIQCGNTQVSSSRLLEVAKRQVDYVLGDNPLHMSYMVGYGQKYPRRIHHRASSLPSLDVHPKKMACQDGTLFYKTQNPNPNLLVGAIVAGPTENDVFDDDRTQWQQSEPSTYTNAPMVGALAYFSKHG